MFGISISKSLGFLGEAFRQHKQTRYTRARVYDLLSVAKDPDDKLSRLFDIFLVTMIVLNVLAVMLESVDSIGEPYAAWFFWFEAASVLVFGLEYLLRLWTAVEDPRFAKMGGFWGRLRYALTPIALTDLVAIIPFFIILAGLDHLVDLRFLRILRLRRAFKLTRYSPAMDNIFGVLRAELPTLGTIGFIFLLVIVMAASTIFALEGSNNPAFSSIPGAMRWAVSALTTIGNTGVQPETTLGKAFGLIISVAGVLLVAMVTGVLASGFTFARFKRRDVFLRSVELALRQSKTNDLSEEQRKKLDFERRALGFTAKDAQFMINQVLEEANQDDLSKLEALHEQDEDMLTND